MILSSLELLETNAGLFARDTELRALRLLVVNREATYMVLFADQLLRCDHQPVYARDDHENRCNPDAEETRRRCV